jgi:hypothetical protein
MTTTVFSLTYNAVYSNICDSILFKRFGNLVEITPKIYPYSYDKFKPSIVIHYKELYAHKVLYSIYLLSRLLTCKEISYDYWGNIIYSEPDVYPNYFITGYAIIIKRNNRIPDYMKLYDFTDNLITDKEINAFEFKQPFKKINIEITKSKKLKMNSYKKINFILKNYNSVNFFDKILKNIIDKIELELNSIEIDVIAISFIHQKLLPELVKYIL